MADPNDRSCAHCPRSRAEHDDPDCHHVYSDDGKLTPKPPMPNRRQVGQVVIPIESTVAIRLAQVMRDKKLITQGELDYIMGGPSGAEVGSNGSAEPAGAAH